MSCKWCAALLLALNLVILLGVPTGARGQSEEADCCQDFSPRCSGCVNAGVGYVSIAGSSYDCSPGYPTNPPCDSATSRVCYGPVDEIPVYVDSGCTMKSGASISGNARITMPGCEPDWCD
jgi:hypothetical protein